MQLGVVKFRILRKVRNAIIFCNNITYRELYNQDHDKSKTPILPDFFLNLFIPQIAIN